MDGRTGQAQYDAVSTSLFLHVCHVPWFIRGNVSDIYIGNVCGNIRVFGLCVCMYAEISDDSRVL